MKKYKQQQLLKYLQFYLSKRLHMEVVIRRIVDRLKKDQPITDKQFNSIIKFLERETPFVTMNRSQIRGYFDELISNRKIKETEYGSNTNSHNLTEFFS
jgi:hypothetical protein